MAWGKSILLALALAVLRLQAGLLAGEGTGQIDCGALPYPPLRGEQSLTSLRKNAVVGIGGEIAVDYSYRDSDAAYTAPNAKTFPMDSNVGDLALHHANIRIRADVHPNVSAFMKLDLQPGADRPDGDILEEAMLVMSAVGGTGLGFFGGRGRAPYGQDITLGMLQSYHHNANEWTSSEGPVFITDSPEKDNRPPMRPGQIDRVVMAGASYSWQGRWKVEAAAFQPWFEEYDDRLAGREDWKNPAGIGAAGRIWWRPFEELTVQLSVVAARSGDMARIHLRRDIDAGSGARGAETAYAFSAGFDWRRGAWRVFGEYQRGMDWNFTKGYDTDTLQLGAAVEVLERWRVGAMAEGLRIDDGAGAERVKQDYFKLALNVRHAFDNGFFVLAEYGREWMRRERGGDIEQRRRGNFAGVRMGFSF